MNKPWGNDGKETTWDPIIYYFLFCYNRKLTYNITVHKGWVGGLLITDWKKRNHQEPWAPVPVPLRRQPATCFPKYCIVLSKPTGRHFVVSMYGREGQGTDSDSWSGLIVKNCLLWQWSFCFKCWPQWISFRSLSW